MLPPSDLFTVDSFPLRNDWNSALFRLSLIIEGATEKVSLFTMPLKSVYNKNFYFNEKEIFTL